MRSATPPVRTARRSSPRRRMTATAEAARLTDHGARADRGRAPDRARLAAQRGGHARPRPRRRRHRRVAVRRQEGPGRRRPLPRRARGVRRRRRRRVMGSASTQALAATTAALDAASGVDLDVAGELFAAARAVGDSSQLSGALADSAAPAEARRQVVADVFGAAVQPHDGVAADDRRRAALVVGRRPRRRASRSSRCGRPRSPTGSADVEAELFRVLAHRRRQPRARARARQPARRRRRRRARSSRRCCDGRASAATTLIVSSLVQQPRERRVRQLLTRATRLVADQRGRTVATVVAAAPLSAAQSERLTAALSQALRHRGVAQHHRRPDRRRRLRVQIADDVIDASVSARLADLRQRLAG